MASYMLGGALLGSGIMYVLAITSWPRGAPGTWLVAAIFFAVLLIFGLAGTRFGGPLTKLKPPKGRYKRKPPQGR